MNTEPYRPDAAIEPGAQQIAQWLGGRLEDSDRAPERAGNMTRT